MDAHGIGYSTGYEWGIIYISKALEKGELTATEFTLDRINPLVGEAIVLLLEPNRTEQNRTDLLVEAAQADK
jgi:hypothetical protein